MVPLGAIFLGSHLLIAVADDLAKFDLNKTCRLAAGVQTTPTQDAIKSCIDDEQSARDTLTQGWAKYAAADKSHCVQMATKGYLPSYVELLTCLEMSSFAKTIPQEIPQEDVPRGKARRR
jgi:hypothetical protein